MCICSNPRTEDDSKIKVNLQTWNLTKTRLFDPMDGSKCSNWKDQTQIWSYGWIKCRPHKDQTTSLYYSKVYSILYSILLLTAFNDLLSSLLNSNKLELLQQLE